MLRNINPDLYYPVYGDDSTTVDDAPTQGKFFVRLEKGQSQVMWGNFLDRMDRNRVASVFANTLWRPRKISLGRNDQLRRKALELLTLAAEPGNAGRPG